MFQRYLNTAASFAPDDEGGAPEAEIETGDVGGEVDNDTGSEGSDEGGSDGKPLSVREQLKKSIAEVSGEQDQQPKPKKDPKTGRFAERKPAGDAAPAEPAAAAPAGAEVAPPAGLPKELAESWKKTPPDIQNAFVKREQDMAQGVEAIKSRYALIDQAIAPHTDALRQMNATPGDAVNRMFLWFKALARSPGDAFPALAKSMGVDWARLNAPAGAAAPVDPAAVAGAPEIPAPVRDYVGKLEQQVQQLGQVVQQMHGGFSSIQEGMQTQNEARTKENLSIWSKEKPYFEEVRLDMAKLIETGVVPLKADGQVDLDTAYERAIYFNPMVRAKVIAEQQQADTQVQQQTAAAATTAQQSQVNRARKAATSLPVGTPGTPAGAPVKKKPGQKMSVRDSLKAAVTELRDQ